MAPDSAVPGPSAAPERRYLTILFSDLVGYTELSERIDPEDLRDLQVRYQRLALTVMERYGGFVARFSGDGVLVYFGYPAAHENDAERAVRAGLELVERLIGLDERLDERQVPQLSSRIGIHTGLVVVGPEAASAGRTEHGIVGEAVNLAFRLQAEAPPNAVVVSKETLDLVEGLVASEALGPRKIKGFSRTISVHKITKAFPVSRRSHDRWFRGATRMVGREMALDRLLSHWRKTTQERRGSTIMVIGEAGVGKTRLVQTLCEHSDCAGATVLQLNCHELFAGTPLYAVGTFFWWRIGLTTEDDETTRIQKISELLKDSGVYSAENIEIIRSIVDLSATISADALAPPALLWKRKQFSLIITLIEQITRRRPVLLWIEDAHWLDPSSAELLSEITGRLADARMLVLLTLRSFPRTPHLPTAGDVIYLEPLTLQECLELARSVPGAEALPGHVLARALEVVDGIPLFVEQLVLMLFDQAAGMPIANRKHTRLPLTLAELMSERLDRLHGGRRFVQAAACIGRSFTPEFLGALLEDKGRPVVEQLEALTGAEILRRRQDGTEIRYEFCHALLQRMAYESMIQTDRRAMHARIADVLKRRTSSGAPIPEMMAHHLTAAGEFHGAVKAWLDAGVSAAQRSAPVEAIEHFRRGLSLLDRISDLSLRRQLELNLQAALIGSLTATQSPTSQELSVCCERGLQLCNESDASPRMFPFIYGQFVFANLTGRVGEAAALSHRFLTLAEGLSHGVGRVIGHRLMGMVLLGQGDAQKAKEHFEQSLRLYSPERDAATMAAYGQNAEVHSRSLLSLTLFCLGEVDEALRVGLEALRAADGWRHPHSTAIALAYVGGYVLAFCGATEPLMREARRLISVSKQHRLVNMHTFGEAFLGWGLCQSGNLDQGITVLERAIDAFDAVNYRLTISAHLATLADAKRRGGRLDEAQALCARAKHMISESSARWLEPEVLRIDALIASELRPQAPEKVRAAFLDAVECAKSLCFPVFELRCLLSLRDFLGPHRKNAKVDSRIEELSTFHEIDRRAVKIMRSREVAASV
jgi:class 3 adenylate cyclase/tetratricopeptide (TPR) repeat protein